jgi:hypothetical protein
MLTCGFCLTSREMHSRPPGVREIDVSRYRTFTHTWCWLRTLLGLDGRAVVIQAVALALVGALPAATGRKMHYTGTTVLRLKDGKIAEEVGLDDGVIALQQLGLIKAA